MKHIALFFGIFLLLSIGQHAAAQKTEIQAPIDSYVCFDSTYLDCAKRNVGNLKELLGSRIRVVPAPVNELDLELDVRLPTSDDGKVECTQYSGWHPPRLNLAYPFKVIFLSPEYLLQLREAARRIEAAFVACRHLVARYQAQSTLIEIQDRYAIASDEFQLLQTQWQVRSIAIGEFTDHATCRLNYGFKAQYPDPRALNNCIKLKTIPDWREGFETHEGKTWLKIHDGLAVLKLETLQHARDLRQHARETLVAESVRQGKELSLALESSITDMYRVLLAMTTMAVTSSKKGSRLVSEDSYVTRGTVVLRLR